MKHLKKVLFIFLVVAGFTNLNAQNVDNPWVIELGTNAVDFYPTGADTPSDGYVPYEPYTTAESEPYIGDTFEDFFNVEDHWNTAAVVSRIRVGRYIGAGFSIGLAGTFNSIDQIGNYETDDLSYFGLDFDMRWNFMPQSWFDPYLLVGGGYTWLDEEGNGTLNGGLGINFWFNEFIGMHVQSAYKHSFDEAEMLPHFQHALGVNFRFGGKDTDGDGIYDKHDACPEVAGLEAFNGCPDTDMDGIQDSEDACPTVAGLAELNGCPDADGDGIADKDDACPNIAGPAEHNGCPDADGDGVIDNNDNCPNVAGPAENQGCPWPDTDGDGVLDKDDNCPNIVGLAENQGCPAVTEEVQKEITDLARAIFFNTNKATFTEEAKVRLTKITEILKDYTAVNFTVEGHTDDTGSAEYNKKLSQKRADAVRDYLIEKGFPADKMTAVGYGEEKPICEKKTTKCRQANRRVDIFSENAKRD
ncbi:MAG: OmpA family protein [Bacteroidota bacterium]